MLKVIAYILKKTPYRKCKTLQFDNISERNPEWKQVEN